ncbi:hypothetical protein GLOTRDRAFT_101579 [Gloeophyllum trabeum ATCC 11539]|uniref:Uncharacterized protein n=1 Tax=Gloeophyllum trabeum (strain ATCC 11539 / FP-39264 / Madison 617) TaxID=670483 RepID=S7PTF9_GLOTA|nr:uncharacterized protein GLOTRDRAFT_101579 [Gloeophyllum trabeum ATCC 11539]EPQ51036.1 hypothetical protein GLOTRDRAFT_101579 [Gloeophyllum trabeum ATCC 11539]
MSSSLSNAARIMQAHSEDVTAILASRRILQFGHPADVPPWITLGNIAKEGVRSVIPCFN